MTDDWPQIRARLEKLLDQPYPIVYRDILWRYPSDIRAALQRVEELERDHHPGSWLTRALATEAKLARVVEAGQRCMEISTALASSGIVGHQNILDVMGAALAAAKGDK